jgi:hypothetical protein
MAFGNVPIAASREGYNQSFASMVSRAMVGARFNEVVTIELPIALWLPMAAIEQALRNLL